MHASYSRAFARDSAAWQGWFEAPISATYMFMLRNDVDVTSTLTWSGDDSAAETETLAISGERSVSPPPAAPPLPALTRSATMSSIYGDWGGHRCIDGFRGGTSCHTLCNSGSEWLSIDLSGGQGVLMSVGAIQIYNRHVNQNRLDHHQIWVGTSATKFGEPALLCADVVAPPTTGPFEYDCGGMVGSHVTVLLPGSATHRRCLSLNEVVIDADVAPPATTACMADTIGGRRLASCLPAAHAYRRPSLLDAAGMQYPLSACVFTVSSAQHAAHLRRYSWVEQRQFLYLQ